MTRRGTRRAVEGPRFRRDRARRIGEERGPSTRLSRRAARCTCASGAARGRAARPRGPTRRGRRGESLPKTVLARRFGVRVGELALADRRAHPLVVGAVGEDELDLVARADVLEVRPAVAVRLAAARGLQVHDLVDARIDAGHVGLAARLDEHRAPGVAELASSAGTTPGWRSGSPPVSSTSGVPDASARASTSRAAMRVPP